jgi:hypothetical protein
MINLSHHLTADKRTILGYQLPQLHYYQILNVMKNTFYFNSLYPLC